MQTSLLIKINFIIICVVSLGVLALGVYDYSRTKAAIKEGMLVSISQVSERLQKAAIMPMWNVDYSVLENVIVTEMNDHAVLAVKVEDEITGKVVISKKRGAEWDVIDGFVEKNEECLKKSMPLILNDILLGSLTLCYTDRFSQQELEENLRKMISQMALFLIAVVAVLSYVINRIITEPLRELTEVTRVVAAGGFEQCVELDRRDEMGILARSFDHMRLAVKDKIHNLNEEIEDRKKIEADLLELRNLLTNVIDSMPSVLVGVDEQLRITQWNKEAEKIMRKEADEVLGQDLEDALPQISSKVDSIKKAIREHKIQKEEKQVFSFGGEEKMAEIAVYPLMNSELSGAVIRIDDITECVRFEEMIIQTEKMMSVSGLAAGMAHEINNPLAGIMQNLQVVQNRLAPGLNKNRETAEQYNIDMDDMKGYLEARGVPVMLDIMMDSGKRAAAIVENMLSFSRKSTSGYISYEMSDLLEQAVELMTTDYDLKNKIDFKNISLKREYRAGLPLIKCDSILIKQVFFNLLKNAAQAVYDKDAVEKRTKDGDVPQIILSVSGDDQWVHIKVHDNGSGIDKKVLNRVFEPFFTTKTVGQGVGLGLSVSYFIVVETHRGCLTAESKGKGEGTVFTVSLPVLEEGIAS